MWTYKYNITQNNTTYEIKRVWTETSDFQDKDGSQYPLSFIWINVELHMSRNNFKIKVNF